MAKRKNKSQGSHLVRKCWCNASKNASKGTCPVHVLGPFFAKQGVKSHPFVHISADAARNTLRAILKHMGVPKAEFYNTKDFRRGHAFNLQLSGWPRV